MHLAALQESKLYQIALNAQTASSKFNELEKIALHRHHQLLSFAAPTLSQYNQNSPAPEAYYLLLLHLEHYPDDLAAYKRLKEFFDSAFNAGFYTIAFASRAIFDTDNKAVRDVLDRFPHLPLVNQKVQLSQACFELAELTQLYDFEYVNDNKDLIIENLHSRRQTDTNNGEQEFLAVPIGSSVDGQRPILFSLGDNSRNDHAFITGVTGSGKSTLLNTIILGIAQHFTVQPILPSVATNAIW